MIKCNLAVLLAERNLKITKVATDTGISRTTLTSLANNYSQGIQFDTLNSLCSYLRITPADFFCYVPFEVDVEVTSPNDPPYFEILLKLRNSRGQSIGQATLLAGIEGSDGALKDEFGKIHLTTVLNVFVEFPNDEINTAFLKRYLKDIPPVFKNDIDKKIGEGVVEFYRQLDHEDSFQYAVFWDDAFS